MDLIYIFFIKIEKNNYTEVYASMRNYTQWKSTNFFVEFSNINNTSKS